MILLLRIISITQTVNRIVVLLLLWCVVLNVGHETVFVFMLMIQSFMS